MSNSEDDEALPILNYADPKTDTWVVIARFADEITAHLAAGLLQADEIECRLANRLYSSMGKHPTTMEVRSDDAIGATDLLKTSPAARWVVSGE